MSPTFSTAIDPVFEHVLNLLERIEKNEAKSPQEERQAIMNRLSNSDAQLGNRQGWDLAKYALVSWIDEVLINAPWPGQRWWLENSLEFVLFRTRDCATQFFEKANEAANLTRRDALEVFYVCVVLGFRGLFGLPETEATRLAGSLGVQYPIEAWAKQISRSIQLGQGRPSIGEHLRPRMTAPPMDSKYLLVGTMLVGVILTAFTSVIGFFAFYDQIMDFVQ